METWMKFLQQLVTTLKDNQRQGRWDRLEVYLSDRERPWKPPTTLSFHLCHMETTHNTFRDRQRPWKTANDWQWFPTTQILQWLRKTVNDWQWVSLAPKVAV